MQQVKSPKTRPIGPRLLGEQVDDAALHLAFGAGCFCQVVFLQPTGRLVRKRHFDQDTCQGGQHECLAKMLVIAQPQCLLQSAARQGLDGGRGHGPQQPDFRGTSPVKLSNTRANFSPNAAAVILVHHRIEQDLVQGGHEIKRFPATASPRS
jgi:hypothetical protein